MGSLGDKFKKLAGDQTRQLLQNFQNAQSSKTRNGYSYGKLNEDGTATLADGTVVQTVVKGRPGQYAPVFNLGNGQGLVDQPEAKFFNIDGQGVLNYWAIKATMASLTTVPSIGVFEREYSYQFNVVGIQYIEIYDLIRNKTYVLDRQLWENIPNFPVGTSHIETGFQQQTTFTAGPLHVNATFISGGNQNSLVDDSLSFCYGGIQVLLSTDGRDILLYQTSNFRSDVAYTDSLQSINCDAGELSITYTLLKDIFADGDIMKCESTQSGKYTFPLIDPQNTETRVSDSPDSAGYYKQYNAQFYIFLSRNSNNEPQLDVGCTVSTINAFYAPFLYTEGQIYTNIVVVDLLGEPRISWQESQDEVLKLIPPPTEGTSIAVFGNSYRGQIYGYHTYFTDYSVPPAYPEYLTQLVYKANPESFIVEEYVGAFSINDSATPDVGYLVFNQGEDIILDNATITSAISSAELPWSVTLGNNIFSSQRTPSILAQTLEDTGFNPRIPRQVPGMLASNIKSNIANCLVRANNSVDAYHLCNFTLDTSGELSFKDIKKEISFSDYLDIVNTPIALNFSDGGQGTTYSTQVYYMQAFIR